ncbi:MAG: SET domain-containing protein-lysine N-methyltransferase, partial [Ferruginibacter sp.]
GADLSQCCMALGLIPLYNHHSPSNAEYFMEYEQEQIFIKSVRPIQAGEEITINYNGDWNDTKPLWFDQQDPV